MKNSLKNITLFVFLFSLLTAKCQTDNSTNLQKESMVDSLQMEINYRDAIYNNLIQLSSGEFKYYTGNFDDFSAYGFNYRVEITQSEIYRSVVINKIEYFGEGFPMVSNKFKLDIENLLGINSEMTNQLEFIKWVDFNSLILKVRENLYKLKIDSKEGVFLDKTFGVGEIHHR